MRWEELFPEALRCRGRFQFQPEGAAFARLGSDAEPAADSFDGFSHNRQTDAGAFVFGAEALEHAEDAFVRVSGYSNAVVLNVNANGKPLG